jgi:type IV pilus assembly protein PilO
MNRAGGIFTKLNLHLAVVGVVLALDIFIGARFALAWRAIRADQSGEFVQQQLRYGQLRAQMQHLNGLPQKVDAADVDAQKFYEARIAPNYSTMLAQLMGTAEKDHVQLSRSGYAQETALPGLTEVTIDAGLSGQYTDMVHFINDVERDKDHVFFLIDGITLTGEQGGLVNLRLRLRTYLRSDATDLPPVTNASAAAGEPGNGETR